MRSAKRLDGTVRILAEGVEMSYAVAPLDDPEVFVLGAVVGSVDGLSDEERICEEALAWNATNDTSLSLVSEEANLRVVRCGDAEVSRGFVLTLDNETRKLEVRGKCPATWLYSADRLTEWLERLISFRNQIQNTCEGNPNKESKFVFMRI